MEREHVRLNQLPAVPEPDERERARAVRRVASAATDAQDCAMLLEALGLWPEQARDQASTSKAS